MLKPKVVSLPPRQRIQRKANLKVGLSDDVLARLVKLSELFGIPTGTLASFALGQFTAQQERSLGFLQSVSDNMGDAFREQMEKITTSGEQLNLPK